jgi:hypothetical protein
MPAVGLMEEEEGIGLMEEEEEGTVHNAVCAASRCAR